MHQSEYINDDASLAEHQMQVPTFPNDHVNTTSHISVCTGSCHTTVASLVCVYLDILTHRADSGHCKQGLKLRTLHHAEGALRSIVVTTYTSMFPDSGTS